MNHDVLDAIAESDGQGTFGRVLDADDGFVVAFLSGSGTDEDDALVGHVKISVVNSGGRRRAGDVVTTGLADVIADRAASDRSDGNGHAVRSRAVVSAD